MGVIEFGIAPTWQIVHRTLEVAAVGRDPFGLLTRGRSRAEVDVHRVPVGPSDGGRSYNWPLGDFELIK